MSVEVINVRVFLGDEPKGNLLGSYSVSTNGIVTTGPLFQNPKGIGIGNPESNKYTDPRTNETKTLP